MNEMGVDYSASLGIGYHYKLSTIIKTFATKIPAVTREEDRYDVKTGAKLSPTIIVVSEPYLEYKIGDKVISDHDGVEEWHKHGYELDADTRALKYIAESVGCKFTEYGCNMTRNGKSVVLHPEINGIPDSKHELSYHFSLGKEYELLPILEMRDQFIELGAKLVELGLPEIAPRIGYAWQVN